jgi:uncharacterized membrane protein
MSAIVAAQPVDRPRQSSESRDHTFDAARGIAILTMIWAHLVAAVLVQPHPLAVRLYGSFAAPLFMFLSGASISFFGTQKRHGILHYLARGSLLLAVGASIDILLWRVYPFTTVDVLYLLGLAQPLVFMASWIGPKANVLLGVGIMALSPLLQQAIGYDAYPTEIELGASVELDAHFGLSILRHWLVDGFFPVFPWLGFCFLGNAFGIWRANSELPPCGTGTQGRWTGVLFTGVLFAGGLLAWSLYPGPLFLRGDYSELFYPPTAGYVVTAVAVVLCVIQMLDCMPRSSLNSILEILGKRSLFVYVIHILYINIYTYIYYTWLSLGEVLVVYLVISTLVLLSCRCIDYAMRNRRPGFVARFFLGA